MDTGSLIAGVSAVASIIVAIFLATIVLVWQSRSQSDKFERGLSELRTELRAEIRAQGDRFEQRHNELRAELRADIQGMSSRISESEREQARLEGVNSVLQRHTHTHEPQGADD